MDGQGRVNWVHRDVQRSRMWVRRMLSFCVLRVHQHVAGTAENQMNNGR